jgi:predicted protein tyrosine phosphatase
MAHVRKKVLCVCEGGSNRSVCATNLLKDGCAHGHDALAVGWRFNDSDTLAMLCMWAQIIIVMEPYMVEKIPPVFKGKIKVCDVGPDVYGHPKHPALINKVWNWMLAEGLVAQ